MKFETRSNIKWRASSLNRCAHLLDWTSMTPYKSERASNATSPVDHTEKRKMIMASKDNKRKYVDGAKEEVEEVPPKKQRMISDDNGDDIDDDNVVKARGGGNEPPSRI
jgi:hypothetical protein